MHPSPNKVETNKPQYFTTVVHTNKKDPPLEGGKYWKIGGMWTLKLETSSPKLYKLLPDKNIKGDTALDIKKFYNHINIFLNVVTKVQEYLLPVYKKIKRHYKFHEHFLPDCYHPSYYRNVQMYTSLGHSLLMAFTNDTCIKSSMAPQAYKVVTTHTHETSGWTILYIIIHARSPNIGGTNYDIQ